MQLLAFLMFTERLGPLPAYLLYFYLASISNKCTRLIDNVREVSNPKPRRRVWKLTKVAYKPHTESSADSWFCYLLKHHGFESLLDKRGPLRAVEASENLQSPFVFLPINRNYSNTIRFSKCIDINQMLANILNPKPDGFPLLLSL